MRRSDRAPNVLGMRPIRVGSGQIAASSHLTMGDYMRPKVLGEGIVMECKFSGNDFEITVVFRTARESSSYY